jgi:hypothetical protein
VGHDDDVLYVDGQILTATRPVDELGGRSASPRRRARRPTRLDRHPQLVIALSVVLGVFNLLPVPMLDGGHLAMYLYEAVRGKALSLRAQELSLKVGFHARDRFGADRYLQRHQADHPHVHLSLAAVTMTRLSASWHRGTKGWLSPHCRSMKQRS